MPLQLHSIKSKLLIGALFLTLNVAFLSGISLYHFQRISEINALEELMYHLQVEALRLMKTDNNFINYDALNLDFFRSGSSKILAQRKSHETRIDSLKNLVLEKSDALSFDLSSEISEIDSLLNIYDQSFDRLKELLHQRGFKDFGLIGQMRHYAHELESSKLVNSSVILMLRRHEKDFQLRNDLAYVVLFDTLMAKTKSESLKKNENTAFRLLTAYDGKFKELVKLEAQLGISNNSGFKNYIDQLNEEINAEISSLTQTTSLYSAQTLRKGNYLFFVSVAFALSISLVLSYFMAIRISRPLRKLSSTMDHFIVGASSSSYNLKNESSERADSEISMLTNSFINLSRKVKSQFVEIKSQSDLLEKQNLELRQVNNQLDRFVYAAAHDLRAPLTSVLGLINITEREMDRNEIKGNLDMMRASILRLDSLIKDMVDFSKNKRSELETKKIDLRSLIEDIYNNQKHASERAIHFSIIETGLKEFYNDSKRTDIILRNIISNSIKYTDDTKVESFINIWIETKSDAVKIIVVDNGIGIENNYLPNIFDMFYRATERSKGSGLGLFLVKETLEMLEGSIQIDSTYQLGTSVTVVIPNLKKNRKRTKAASIDPILV